MCTTETPYLSSEFSRADESAPDTSRSDVLCQLAYPYLRVNRFQGKKLLKRKDNSSQGSRWRLRLRLRYRSNVKKVPVQEY